MTTAAQLQQQLAAELDKFLLGGIAAGNALRLLAALHGTSLDAPDLGVPPAYARLVAALSARMETLRDAGITQAQALQVLRTEGWHATLAEHTFDQLGV